MFSNADGEYCRYRFTDCLLGYLYEFQYLSDTVQHVFLHLRRLRCRPCSSFASPSSPWCFLLACSVSSRTACSPTACRPQTAVKPYFSSLLIKRHKTCQCLTSWSWFLCTGTMLGLCSSVQSLLRTVGPTIGGFLYVNFGVSSIGTVQFVMNVIVFAYLLQRHLRKTDEQKEWRRSDRLRPPSGTWESVFCCRNSSGLNTRWKRVLVYELSRFPSCSAEFAASMFEYWTD